MKVVFPEYSFSFNIITFHRNVVSRRIMSSSDNLANLGKGCTALVTVMRSYNFKAHFYVYQKVKIFNSSKQLYSSKHFWGSLNYFIQNLNIVLWQKVLNTDSRTEYWQQDWIWTPILVSKQKPQLTPLSYKSTSG